jgi:MOSC domain-containing protein YiiM
LIAAAVLGVSRSATHSFSKQPAPAIRLLAGLGVAGDAHMGVTVRHRSRVKKTPDAPNLRQVHLLQAELLEELRAAGFDLRPGSIGENITTRGLDLLGLPTGTSLYLGAEAVVEITGLRNPCLQLDRYQPGLMAAVLDRAADGTLIRKAGVMAIVRAGGEVRPGDPIRIALPEEPHRKLECV